MNVNDLRRRKHPSELQPGIQITQAGSHLKARFVGTRDAVFGVDVPHVLLRLRTLEEMRSSPKAKQCDVFADRKELLGDERFAAKAVRSSRKFDPR